MKDTVIIVGAGPAGLMLACELGLAGVEAVVLERAAERNSIEKSRAHTLHARAVELLDQRGLFETLAREEPPKWPLIHYANFWLDLSQLLDREYSLLVSQGRLEHLLEDRAEELGVEIRRGHEVTGLVQDEAGVTVETRSARGGALLGGRYLVGCDGASSTVRDLARFTAPASGICWYGVLADFEDLEADFASPTYPDGIVAVIPHPIRPGRTRMMTMEFGVEAPGDDAPVTLDELRACAMRITGREWTIGQPDWLHRYHGVTRHAEAYRRGRVFLAGDAAHVHYFGAGHGVSTALHDAANLGWKLAADIRGWAPPGLLDSYHAERHPVGHRACTSTQAQLTLQHPPEQVGPLREVFGELVKFENVNRHLVGIVTDVRYPMAHPGANGHPLLGCRVAHVPLRAGRGVLVDLSGGSSRLGDLSGWTDRIDVVTEQPTAAIAAAALLLRPDGHVAWADTTGTDAAGLRSALAAWFGAPTGEPFDAGAAPRPTQARL